MKKYLIKLKPIEKCFFGEDKGFNTSEFRKEDNHKSYILNSRNLPQQSSILGMLRFEILNQSNEFDVKQYSNYIEEDFKKMSELIGKKSFEITDDIFKFGVVKRVGTVNIFDDNKKEILYKVPLDHKVDFEKKNNKYKAFKFSSEKVQSSFGEINYFSDFNAKDGLSSDFVNVNNEIVKEKDIFKDFTQVGVDTEKMKDQEKTEDNEKNAFYKQTFKMFKKDFCFAFYLELNDFELKDSIVELGKERSTFKMEVIKIKTEKEIFSKFDDKIYFESDVYLTYDQMKEIEKKIKFKINTSISFRNIKTSKNSYTLNKEKYNFLSRGSLLFVNSDIKLDIIKIIEKNKNLLSIGYNTVY